MGIYADLLASAKTIDVGNTTAVGESRALVRELEGLQAVQGDLAYPSGFAVANEVQSIAVYPLGTGVDGGTFTLTVTLNSGETFTTAAIAFGASAATIKTALNTAATAASIFGWTNNDIATSGGALTTAPLVLTFSGVSVAGKKHGLTVITSSLTASAAPALAGAVSVNTDGQTNRTALAILTLTGVLVAATPPVQGQTGSYTAATAQGSPHPNRPSAALIRALAKEVAATDANSAVNAMSDYRKEARADAVSTVENYEDEIAEKIFDDGEASDDLLNDYGHGDSYHHERHVDKYYDLSDAAEVLDELSDFEETDTGLWEGLAPREAIGAQAAYTYGAAVYSFFQDLIKEVNDAVTDALSDLDDKHAEEDEEGKAAVENKREGIREKMRSASVTAKRREALQEKLDDIEDYDADEHDAEREAAKKATIKETIEQCCLNF